MMTIRAGDVIITTKDDKRNSWVSVDVLQRATVEEQAGFCPAQSCMMFMSARDVQECAAFFSSLDRQMRGVENGS